MTESDIIVEDMELHISATYSHYSCKKINCYFIPKDNQKYFHRIKHTNYGSVYFCYTLCNLNHNFIYSGQSYATELVCTKYNVPVFMYHIISFEI